MVRDKYAVRLAQEQREECAYERLCHQLHNTPGLRMMRGSSMPWHIPKVSAEFVANMEDVLDLYAEPHDPQRPVVCFDETSTQLLAETRPPLPPRPGRPLRQDYEYRREGTRNLFLACEPLAGWRHVAVTERRTMQDFAHRMRWLVDEAPRSRGGKGRLGQSEHPSPGIAVRDFPG